MMNNRPPQRGLTLIELLVALGIMALLSTALVVALRQGVMTWRRLQQVSAGAQALREALTQLDRDAAHAVLLAGANDTPPVLTATALELVTAAYPSEAMPQLTRVWWRVEPQADGTQTLTRLTAPYPALPTHDDGRVSVQLDGLRTCEFAYAAYDRVTQHVIWEPAWTLGTEPDGVLPQLTRVTIAPADQPLSRRVHPVMMPVGRMERP